MSLCAARRDRGQGEPRHRRQDAERIVGARGRLEAETARPRPIRFSPQLTDRADDPDVRESCERDEMFEVRVFGRAGQKSQLRERVSQLHEEISAQRRKEQAKDKEPPLVEKELIGVRQLYEQRLIQISRLTVWSATMPGCRASVRNTSPRVRRRGQRSRTELQSSRSTRTWSARSPRICSRPTTRSASSSERQGHRELSCAASTSARRRTAVVLQRRCTPWAASSPPATPS